MKVIANFSYIKQEEKAMTEKSPWPIAAAQGLLKSALRNALEDKAFGDMEVSWHNATSRKMIADGYIGRSSAHVTLLETEEHCPTTFHGQEARSLESLGQHWQYARNDEQA